MAHVPSIHCITDLSHDPNWGSGRELDAFSRVIAHVASAGVDAVQVRAKHLHGGALYDLTTMLVRHLRPRGVAVIVNDRLDVALAADADGVHLGHSDLPLAAAREMAPPGFLIGATCRNRSQAAVAASAGADYAGVGPVYDTTSKPGLPASIGTAGLLGATGVLPVIAIGGITAAAVPEVMAAGAHGVAVMGSVFRAPEPAAAARDIVAAVRKVRP